MASTQNSTPRSRHRAPRVRRSLRAPLPNSTEDKASMRTWGLRRASSTRAGSRRPSRVTSIWVSTPWSRRCHQGYTFDGYSRSQVTTRSPRRQSRPAATIPSPSVVFFTKAISSVCAPQEHRRARADALDLGVEGAPVAEGALFAGLGAVAAQGFLHARRDGRDARVVQVGELPGDGEEAACAGPVHDVADLRGARDARVPLQSRDATTPGSGRSVRMAPPTV